MASGAARYAAPFVVCAAALCQVLPAWAQGPSERHHGGFWSDPKSDTRRRFDFLQKDADIAKRLDKLPPREKQGVDAMRRMVIAGLSNSFVAREVSLSASGRETEQWIRWNPQRGLRRESIRPNPGEVWLDNFDKAYTFQPREKRWQMRDTLLPRPQGRVGDVMRRLFKGELRATVEGQDTIAGRACDIVRVGPPENAAQTGVPSRRFWIDRATGLRLKMEEVTPNGRVLSSSYLLSLDTHPNFRPDDFTAPKEAVPMEEGLHGRRRTYKSYAEAAGEGVPLRQPAYLPTGFALRQVEVFGKDKGRPLVTQRFANGLTVLSLMQAPVGVVPPPPPVAGRIGNGPQAGAFLAGPRGGGERAYLWNDGGFSYALLGNLSDDEMKRIAASVR